MRELPHDAVISELDRRGYSLNGEWIGDYEADQVDRLGEALDEDASSAGILDWLEVEGQVTDGLFEDPRSVYDFTQFFTEFEGLVARLLYFGIATQGREYSYEDLVDDIESLSNTAYYDAPFDRDTALNARR